MAVKPIEPTAENEKVMGMPEVNAVNKEKNTPENFD